MNQTQRLRLVIAALLFLLSLPQLSAATSAEELINAINHGDETKAILLLKQGADPNTRDIMTQPAITAAAYLGREKIVRALLASHADFRAVDNDGANALHAAAGGGHQAIVELLLASGLAADDRARTDGMSPLAYASVRGHLKVMRLLLDRQVNPNLPDSGGNTPLIHAALRGRTDAVRLLLARGAKVNAASSHGWTPLMAAAWEGHTSIVKDLLKHGANRSLVNREHRSALLLAESEGHQATAKLLNAAN